MASAVCPRDVDKMEILVDLAPRVASLLGWHVVGYGGSVQQRNSGILSCESMVVTKKRSHEVK